LGYFFWRQVLIIINHKLKNQKMKKVLFVFAIAAAFAACNDSATTETPKVDSVVATMDSVVAKADSTVTAVTDSAKVVVDSLAKKVDSLKK
jgi:uncharacterized lipoprotein YajG